ncbi:MAG: hypothetical protein AB7D37_09160 [Desulfovibrio sp.]
MTGHRPLATKRQDPRQPVQAAPREITGRKPGGRRQPPAGYLGKSPRESDMSMNDLAIIAGAIVVLALIGFVFYKRIIKN